MRGYITALVDAFGGDLSFESTPAGMRVTLRFESSKPAVVAA